MRIHEENTLLDIAEISVWGLEVKVSYTIETSGIGWYEFWGAKYYDKGEQYPEIMDIEPIFTTETIEEREEILSYINEHFEECAEQVAEKIILNKEL